MEVDKTRLLDAAAKAGITGSQAEKLWGELVELDQHHPITAPDKKFGLANVMYYLGAMIVILAMGWLTGLGWEHFGDLGIFGIAVLYTIIFAFIGNYLWVKKQLRIPGGLFITMSVCMIPLAIYGFERFSGWWIIDDPSQYKDYYAWIKGGWFLIEIGTIIAEIIALIFYRFTFLTAPFFFSLWYMSMDIVPIIYGHSEFLWNERIWVSLWFGLVLLILAYVIDRNTVEDYAFWAYFFGMLAFWFGLSLLESHNEFQRFVYLLINVGLIFLSVLLQRTIFLIFGALGIFVYITTLFYKYFSDSELFPFLLSLIGVMVIFAGILYQKHQNKIEAWILNSMPSSIKNLLPTSRNKPL